MAHKSVRIAGLIVAGGTAQRMGGEKPFLPFCGAPLLDAVISAAGPQCEPLALNIAPDKMGICRQRYGNSHPLLVDAYGGEKGPLGGIVSGLNWLETLSGTDWLATFPCDTPFLPDTLVKQLEQAIQNSFAPVVAVGDGCEQYLCALWPRSARAKLIAGIASGEWSSVWYALEKLGSVRHQIISTKNAFLNINTPEDLREAEQHWKQQKAGRSGN